MVKKGLIGLKMLIKLEYPRVLRIFMALRSKFVKFDAKGSRNIWSVGK